MSKTVATTDVKRASGFLYYVKKGDIWRSPMKKPGGKSAKGKGAKVVSTGIEADYSKYLYFVGSDSRGYLTIERSERAR